MGLLLAGTQAYAQKEKPKRKKEKEKEQVAPTVKQPETPEVQVLRPDFPILRFDSERYNFGKVAQGDMVKYTFSFTNEGGHDLVISSVSASCGCTATNWTHEAVKPGARGEIEISFNTAGKMGPQEKSVSVVANTEPAMKVVYLTGEVVSPSLPLNVQVAPPAVKKD
jgi:hypothetical protein